MSVVEQEYTKMQIRVGTQNIQWLLFGFEWLGDCATPRKPCWPRRRVERIVAVVGILF
jgi:hypothetical protein